jgi:hypothetical protein
MPGAEANCPIQTELFENLNEARKMYAAAVRKLEDAEQQRLPAEDWVFEQAETTRGLYVAARAALEKHLSEHA